MTDPKGPYLKKLNRSMILFIAIIALAIITICFFSPVIIFTYLISAKELSGGLFILILAISYLFSPLLYLFVAYRSVEVDKRGVKIFLNMARKATDSGPTLVWWPFEKMRKIQKSRIRLDYNITKVVTKEGVLDAGTLQERKLSSIEIEVDVVLFVQFGEGDNLLQTVQFSPETIWGAWGKLDEEALKNYLEKIITGSVRTEGAKLTYVEINNRRGDFHEFVERAIKNSKTFDLLGLSEDDIEVSLEQIILPEEIQKSMHKVEEEANDKKATIIKAEGNLQKSKLDAEATKEIGFAAAAVKEKDGFAIAAVEGEKIKQELLAPVNAFNLSPVEVLKYNITQKTLAALAAAGMNFTTIDGAGIGRIIDGIVDKVGDKIIDIKKP